MSTRKSFRQKLLSDEENMDFDTPEKNPNGTPLRRSDRKPTPSKKMIAALAQKSGSKRPKSTKTIDRDSVTDDDEYESDDNLKMDTQSIDCATVLFNQDRDVAGDQLYSFKTPKKRNGMQAFAVNTPKTPLTELQSLSLNSPRTPKSHQRPTNSTAKTPHETRNRNKRALRKKEQELEEEESDPSSDDDSDYDGHDSDSNETSNKSNEDEEEDDDHDDDDDEPRKPRKVATFAKLTQSTGLRQRRKAQGTEFIPNSDDYFQTISSKKNKTSDNTLDLLKSSRLQYNDLFNILKSIRPSDEHEKRIFEMIQDLEVNFDQWMLKMSQGYNIIIYGLGSKQMLLHRFCERHMNDKPVIVINGFFPTITVKEILQSIKCDMLELTATTRNDHEIVDLIAATLNNYEDCHLFLVINNIDGPMLRKTKDQHVLSRLAKIKNVHLIASIDHINAPLMWDQTCMDNYNFIWYDCTTMLPYENETAFENSVFLQNSGDMDLAAMNNVFQSLTTNARGIYMTLVIAQITNQKDCTYPGMPFNDLYRKCRESFLVSSDSALRTQLIEFVDHNMAKLKRSNDGTEHVLIPINSKVLQLFNQQQKE